MPRTGAIFGLVVCLLSAPIFASATNQFRGIDPAPAEELPDFNETLSGPFNGSLYDLAGRAIVIYDEHCLSCLEYLGRAQDAVAALKEHDRRWQWAFVVLSRRHNGSLIQKISRKYLGKIDYSQPLFVFVDENEVVRRFQVECSTPIDAWSFAWLHKGIDERPDDSQPIEDVDRYPLTGSWWSVEGDWNAPRDKVINHLHDAKLHTGTFEMWWLELLSYEELQSLHTDHHREMQGTGSVKWEYVNKADEDEDGDSGNDDTGEDGGTDEDGDTGEDGDTDEDGDSGDDDTGEDEEDVPEDPSVSYAANF